MNACLYLYVKCVRNGRPVQGVLCLSPNVSWDWLEKPPPIKDVKGEVQLMEDYMGVVG